MITKKEQRILYGLFWLLVFVLGYAIGSVHQIHREVQIADRFEQDCKDMNGTYQFGECTLIWEE